MKTFKLISIGIVLLCLAIPINAQTFPGTVMIGGKTSLSATIENPKWKNDDDSGDNGRFMNLGVSPVLGYFLADGLALGAEIPVMYSKYKDEDGDKSTYTSVACTPFARYYFGASTMKPYLHGAVGYGIQKSEYENSDPATWGIFTWDVGGGLAIFLNDKVSVDVGLGYSSTSRKRREDNDTNFKTITGILGLDMGIVVMLY